VAGQGGTQAEAGDQQTFHGKIVGSETPILPEKQFLENKKGSLSCLSDTAA
jgi:hypothetical protein